MGIMRDIWGAVSAKGKGEKAPDVFGTDTTQLGGSGQRFDAQGNPNPNGWYGYEDVPGRPGYTYAGLVYLGKPSRSEVVRHERIFKLWEAQKAASLQKAGLFALQQLTPVSPRLQLTPVSPRLQLTPVDPSVPHPDLWLAPSGDGEQAPVDDDAALETRRNLQRNLALGAAAALTLLVLSR